MLDLFIHPSYTYYQTSGAGHVRDIYSSWGWEKRSGTRNPEKIHWGLVESIEPHGEIQVLFVNPLNSIAN